MNSEERAAEIAAVFYHEWSAEYRTLKLRIQSAIDAAVEEEITTLRATVAGLEKELKHVTESRQALSDEVWAVVDAWDNDAEKWNTRAMMDRLRRARTAVLSPIVIPARTALGGEAAAKARDGKGG